MYYKYFGFKESPFNMTPNSRYFFESAKHTEALSTLIYAVEERKGFVVITGDIGSGKTTVCRTLLNKLSAATQTALITNTHIGGKDLLTTVLEEVRMLSNLETESEKLIQIIFLGQPELKKKLALPKLEQLRQRIAVYYHLTPLSEEDAKKYILYRLKIASKSDRQYFTDQALDIVYQFSKGVPRMINQICDSALLNGFIYEKEVIDHALMQEVVKKSPSNQIMAAPKDKSDLDKEFEKIIDGK